MPNTRKADAGVRAMSKEDMEAFIAFCLSPPRTTAKGVPDKRDQQRSVFKIAALTYLSLALRRGELCSLMWSDLH
jgi:integrase